MCSPFNDQCWLITTRIYNPTIARTTPASFTLTDVTVCHKISTTVHTPTPDDNATILTTRIYTPAMGSSTLTKVSYYPTTFSTITYTPKLPAIGSTTLGGKYCTSVDKEKGALW